MARRLASLDILLVRLLTMQAAMQDTQSYQPMLKRHGLARVEDKQ